MTTTAKSVESSWKNVEASRRRCGAKPERSRRRRSSVGDVCALKFCCDNGIIFTLVTKCLFREKSATQTEGTQAKKRPKKELFSPFLKNRTWIFRAHFEIILLFSIFLVHRSSKKRSSSSKESLSSVAFFFTRY